MYARASLYLALMVTAPAAQAAQQLNAKIQETLMGPTVTGSLASRIVMSEDGEHLAVVTAKGSR